MKFVYLANIGLPAQWAHEIQIMKMCEAFALAGAQVELVVPRRKKHFVGDPFAYYGVKENFKITYLSCLDLRPGSASRFIYWMRNLSFFYSARYYLRNRDYDILYTREQIAAEFFKNFVLEIHLMPEAVKPFHKKIWRVAKKLVVLTSFIENELVQAGVAEEKILIAPDGVDLNEFNLNISQGEAREKTGLPSGKKIILYTGSFYLRDWKGVDVLLEAAGQFGDDALIVLVGGEEGEIKKIKEGYPIKNLILIERQPHAKIPYYLRAADVLVLPNKKGDSTSEKYTSPMKLFEYMACGRPIVASDLPSIREVLNDQNAILVPPNDFQALADGIGKILSDKELAERTVRRGLIDVQNFSWKKRAEKIIGFINDKR